jgi:hypothetical protein
MDSPQLKLFITNQREFFSHYMGEGIDFVYISEVIDLFKNPIGSPLTKG